MREHLPIYYLSRNEINDALWDQCIARAGNGLIYAYTTYLDHMADNWDALVLGDYEAVMPLPWRKKWGIYYVYPPFLTAQLGLFGNNEISAELLQAFLEKIPGKFRLWDFSLNHQNLFALPNFPLHQRSNYVLSLQQPYEKLYDGYRENIRRNIRKSRTYGCKLTTEVKLDDIIGLTKLQAKETPEKDFQNFRNLFQLLEQKNMAVTYGVLSESGQLLASAAFLFSHQRAYYLLVGNHPNGRTLGASHALIDGFIKDHAGRDLWLDFEGSDLRNLAFFYSSFGATEEKYAAIQLNRLPWWLKWAKR